MGTEAGGNSSDDWREDKACGLSKGVMGSLTCFLLVSLDVCAIVINNYSKGERSDL